jgi:hypothetical protein
MSWDKIGAYTNVSTEEYTTMQTAAKQINNALSKIKAEDGSNGPFKPEGLLANNNNDKSAINKLGKRIDKMNYLDPNNLSKSGMSKLVDQIQNARKSYANESLYNRLDLYGSRIKLSDDKTNKKNDVKCTDEESLYDLQVAAEKLIKMSNDALKNDKNGITRKDVADLKEKAFSAGNSAKIDRFTWVTDHPGGVGE